VIPTTFVDVLRATTTTDEGDPIDDNDATPVHVGLHASRVAELSTPPGSSGGSPAGLTPRAMRRDIWRLPPGTDVRMGDRLRDYRDGSVSAVDTVLAQPSMAYAPDVVVKTTSAVRS
jgi:hypothetical protein